MASGDRFYLLELSHRPALHGDVGSLLKIEGVVIGGEGAQAIFMLPNHPYRGVPSCGPLAFQPSTEEWSDWLQRSDNPEILVQGSMEKIFHRKLRYEISGAVQQKIWVADGFKCLYCGVAMGKAQLTIDHFIPLEMGGKNDPSNYLSACRRCNKNKGGMEPHKWCEMHSEGVTIYRDYKWFIVYLAERKLP